jgi:threonine dehydratase
MLTLEEIQQARQRMGARVYLSPLARSETLSQLSGKELYLKLENLQMTGSFKERGALNRMLQLSEAEKSRGVVAASAGNHGQAVAYLGRSLGIRAAIVMPENAPLTKIASTRHYGAEVLLFGQTYAEAYARALEVQKQSGATFIHAFDDEQVIAGQGTIGLELLEQEKDLAAVVVPVGGGGLIGGIALALKQQNPRVKVIGVEAESYTSARLSLEQDRIVPAGEAASLADGIAVKQVGQIPFALMREYVDQMVSVSEEEIAGAILTLLEKEKTVAEGAGAVALAAVLEEKFWIRERKVAVVVSGGNIDVNKLSRIIEHGLVRDGRRVRLQVQVPDLPGSLMRVTAAIAQERANVLEVYHDRTFPEGPVGTTQVLFTLETRGREHAEEVIARLEREGFHPEEQK